MKLVIYLMWAVIGQNEAHAERSFEGMSECLIIAKQLNQAEVVRQLTLAPRPRRQWFCITSRQ